MRPVTKVGILHEGNTVNYYQREILVYLAANERFELVLLSLVKGKETVVAKISRKIRDKGLFKVLSDVAFSFFELLELRLLRAILLFVRTRTNRSVIQEEWFSSQVRINAYNGRFNSCFVNEDSCRAIQELDLDMMYRCGGGGIYKGKILNLSRFGIVSLHHGDNHWNRGGPPGFWEVYQRRTFTGFIIQKLTSSLDGGFVYRRGQVRTEPVYTINRLAVFERANRELIDFFADGVFEQKSESQHSKYVFDHRILTNPDLRQLAIYFGRTSGYFLSKLVWRKLLRRRHNWQIGYQFRSWQGASLLRSQKIIPPVGRFYADPFFAVRDDKCVIFFEDFEYRVNRGVISCAVVDIDGVQESHVNILPGDCHFSFPYLFEYKDELYMIPESRESRTIDLYKCIDFPASWEKVCSIFTDVDAVDTIVFEQNGRWWLATTIAYSEVDRADSRLFFYYSDDPINGDWQSHQDNPIINNPDSGRNGGLLRSMGRLYRVSQMPGFAQYGRRVQIWEIQCSEASIRSDLVQNVEPDFFKYSIGIHHLTGDENFFCFDYERK